MKQGGVLTMPLQMKALVEALTASTKAISFDLTGL